jgi:hypothetical protein
LRKQWLLFFIALILASEGSFVTGVVVQQSSSASVATVQNSQVAAVDAAPSFLNSLGRNIARMTVDTEPFVPWALGLIGVILTLGVLFAFFIHIQIQQTEMLFSGALVAMFAFSLMITNVHILGIL